MSFLIWHLLAILSIMVACLIIGYSIGREQKRSKLK